MTVYNSVYNSNRHYAAQSPPKYRFRFVALSEPSHVSAKELTRNRGRHRRPSTSASTFRMCYRRNGLICQLQLYLFTVSQTHTVKSCSLLFMLPGQGGGSHVSHPITSMTAKALKAIWMRIYSFVLKGGSKKS